MRGSATIPRRENSNLRTPWTVWWVRESRVVVLSTERTSTDLATCHERNRAYSVCVSKCNRAPSRTAALTRLHSLTLPCAATLPCVSIFYLTYRSPSSRCFGGSANRCCRRISLYKRVTEDLVMLDVIAAAPACCRRNRGQRTKCAAELGRGGGCSTAVGALESSQQTNTEGAQAAPFEFSPSH